jgi:lipase chaperone LimK
MRRDEDATPKPAEPELFPFVTPLAGAPPQEAIKAAANTETGAVALPVDTAARLAEMDRARTAWETRISAYLAERNTLLSSAEGKQPAALQQLRDARFTAEEQRLLVAYE